MNYYGIYNHVNVPCPYRDASISSGARDEEVESVTFDSQ